MYPAFTMVISTKIAVFAGPWRHAKGNDKFANSNQQQDARYFPEVTDLFPCWEEEQLPAVSFE